ncbi:unnamed protein product, partial [Ectocarpus sp. 12 AP-2014]
HSSPELQVPAVAGKSKTPSTSNGGGHQPDLPEKSSIQPIDIPFLQEPGGWQLPGNGISMDATGEPKSGTTWLGRLVPDLALHLCGNANNSWCGMGGLAVLDNLPAPKYVFEMVNKTAGEGALFLHFDGNGKHYIPGMKGEPHPGCDNGGRPHENYFGDTPPCLDEEETPTRERLRACLFNTSALCVQYMPSVDPDVRRSMVIIRDPRDVAMSEREMRMKYYRDPPWIRKATPDVFALKRFEILVSWTHQRYLWHTETVMAPSSHVVFYEDLKDHHHGFIGMADFMGLACSEEDALEVWRAHRNPAPHGDYSTHGLQQETIQWMNETMARLLPPSLALRWGVTPTDLGA